MYSNVADGVRKAIEALGDSYLVLQEALDFEEVSLSGDDAKALQGYWDKLADGATVVEPLAASAWSAGFGILTDRFGVTWQIVPAALGAMMQDSNPEKARRVTEAMLKMVKIDIGELQRAYDS